jgi:hypothetical protein
LASQRVTKKPKEMSNEAWVEELLRKSIMANDRHKEAFAKKKANDKAEYEAVHIESRDNVVIQYYHRGDTIEHHSGVEHLAFFACPFSLRVSCQHPRRPSDPLSRSAIASPCTVRTVLTNDNHTCTSC